MLIVINFIRISNILNTKVSCLFNLEINELSPFFCLDLTEIGRKIAEECGGKSKDKDPTVTVEDSKQPAITPEHKKMMSDAMVDVERDRMMLTGDKSQG